MEFIERIFSYIEARNRNNSTRLILGKIETCLENGNDGHSYFTTGLVPFSDVTRMRSQEEEVNRHFTVLHNGPVRIESKADLFQERFFINSGYDGSLQFEPLAISWDLHNKVSYFPTMNLLASYQLVTRPAGETIFWDDPSLPRFGVVEARATSTYLDGRHSLAFVEADSRYVEDYAFQKKCAVFEFYFEERWLKDISPEIDSVLGSSQIQMFLKPGQQIKLMRTSGRRGRYNIQIWGRRLILTPERQTVSAPEMTPLNWPGLKENFTGEDARRSMLDYVYLQDWYLVPFEEMDGFSIHPESGQVGYQGWWDLTNCDRVGRNHVRVELRKLYEGTPDSILRQLNHFAVSKDTVEESVAKYGPRNIGQRAKDLVLSSVAAFVALSELAKIIEQYYDESDLFHFSSQTIEYSGWFSDNMLRSLGFVAEVDIPESVFLNRCVRLVTFFESMKEKPLRAILRKIGVPNESIEKRRAFKLLESIISLAETSESTGLSFRNSQIEILSRTDLSRPNPRVSGLVHLNAIRIFASHQAGQETQENYTKATRYFGIDKELAITFGWGMALDNIYDSLTIEFRAMQELFSAVAKTNSAT